MFDLEYAENINLSGSSKKGNHLSWSVAPQQTEKLFIYNDLNEKMRGAALEKYRRSNTETIVANRISESLYCWLPDTEKRLLLASAPGSAEISGQLCKLPDDVYALRHA